MTGVLQYTGGRINAFLEALSPQRRFRNEVAKFAYDALQTDRTRGQRGRMGLTGDAELGPTELIALREIARDLSQNNPLVKGILATEADDVVGTGTQIQATSDDETWNSETEAAFREQVIDRPFDITRRFGWHQVLWKCYNSYRRDGDDFIVNTEDGPQICEGSQCGSPFGQKGFDSFDVVNGVAVSKLTGRVIGYYIGKPNKWGYIAPDSWKNYQAKDVHHVFNSDRTSFTRGEPVLTSSVTAIQELFEYINAELVAAKINACLATFITTASPSRVPSPFTDGRFPSGTDDKNFKVERITPGLIKYLNIGEDIKSVIPSRPPSAFDPFLLRMFMIIGRPLCLPLMLVTLDFSGATFMNARIAYQAAQKNYKREQEFVIRPLARTLYFWWLADAIRRGDITPIDNAFRCKVICQSWPYVDPLKEAASAEKELANGTTTEGTIVEEAGNDYRDFCRKKVREKKIREEEGLADSEPVPPKNKETE
jgi:capsid protein